MVVISLVLTLISLVNLVITTSVRAPLENVCVIKYFNILLSIDNEFGDTYKWNDCDVGVYVSDIVYATGI